MFSLSSEIVERICTVRFVNCEVCSELSAPYVQHRRSSASSKFSPENFSGLQTVRALRVPSHRPIVHYPDSELVKKYLNTEQC